jgi:hypothetical protein
METRALFERCLDTEFVIEAFNEIGWAELRVERITGSVGETIWVEPQYLRVLS